MEKMGGANAPETNYISSIRRSQTYEVPVSTVKPDDEIRREKGIRIRTRRTALDPIEDRKTPLQNPDEK
jgi:hypothetical protein